MPVRKAVRWVLVAGAVAFGLFNLMLAQGAASISDDCDGPACGQLIQSVLAAIAGLSLLAGAYRGARTRPDAAKIVLFGTVPILLLHIYFVLTDPNESIVFPMISAPPPVVAAVTLAAGNRR